MGSSFSQNMQPEELAVFKKLPVSPTTQYDINIPELPHNRVRTDQKFLIAFIVVAILLLPFLIYTLVMSDIDRFMDFYDTCGNVCGKKNNHYPQWACTGGDYTNEKYLLYTDSSIGHIKGVDPQLLTPRKCVSECPGESVAIFGRCISSRSSRDEGIGEESNGFDSNRWKRDSEVDVVEDAFGSIPNYLNKHAWRITTACLLSVVITMIMVVLFRKATAAVVYGMLGGVVIFGGLIVLGLWVDFLMNKSGDKSGKLGATIVFSIIWLVLLFVLIFMFKKIKLVILLLKEATKAAFDMPQIICIPIITFIVELIICVVLIVTLTVMSTAGSLQELYGDFLYYKMNFVMSFTLIFNFWMAFWAIMFVVGIQYMVIAGAVTKWYFARDKRNLDSPILTSASNVFKFHLGSVAFGSLVITIVAIIRALISSLTKNRNVKACIDCIMRPIEDFIRYLSKNAYIMTAMHGKPFYKSGKRAAKIIYQNAVNIASINFIGDFILGMAQMLIVLISELITVGLLWSTNPNNDANITTGNVIIYIIVFIVSLSVAITAFSPFETIIDTIFLCFCEDSLLNDGMARPYAMSRGLMEFVENSKKLYGEKKI